MTGEWMSLVIVFRQKNLRTVPNLLVVSLALGDFLFVLFCVPFGAVAYSLEYYPFSTFYCRFENFIINLSLGVSVFSPARTQCWSVQDHCYTIFEPR